MAKNGLHKLKKEYNALMAESRGYETDAKAREKLENGSAIKYIMKAFTYKIWALQTLLEGILEYLENKEDREDNKDVK